MMIFEVVRNGKKLKEIMIFKTKLKNWKNNIALKFHKFLQNLYISM